MPLFDFRCRACDKTFELLVRGGQTPLCPHCQGEAHEKLVSRPAPPGQSAALVQRARAQARREGHFSHY